MGVRLRALLLTLLFVALILPLPTHGDGGDCRMPFRWSAGIQARVSVPGGAALHANPGESYRRIATLDEGTTLNITDGPTCADGTWWWQAQTFDGRSGWIAESDEPGYQPEPSILSFSAGIATPRLVP
jgi:Bacterial SH3 domain